MTVVMEMQRGSVSCRGVGDRRALHLQTEKIDERNNDECSYHHQMTVDKSASVCTSVIKVDYGEGKPS